MRRLCHGVTLAGVVLGLVIGGSAGDAPTLAAGAAPIPLRLAYGAPVVQTLPLWAAYDGGFLKRNGFDPAMPVPIPGPEATVALMGGHVDLIATGGFSTALAAGSGAPVRMFAAGSRYAPFVIYTRDALGSPAQLKGLKVGTGFDVSQTMLEEHPDRVQRIAEALVAATDCALVHPAFAQAVMQRYTKITDSASLKRGYEELRAGVPADLSPHLAAVGNIVKEATALHPELNASAVAKFYAPEVLLQLQAKGFMRQAALCPSGP